MNIYVKPEMEEIVLWVSDNITNGNEDDVVDGGMGTGSNNLFG